MSEMNEILDSEVVDNEPEEPEQEQERASGSAPEREWGLTGSEIGQEGEWIALPGSGTEIRLVPRRDQFVRVEYRQTRDFASHGYRARVRHEALLAGEAEDWCQGLNATLEKLDLPIGHRLWNWSARVTFVYHGPVDDVWSEEESIQGQIISNFRRTPALSFSDFKFYRDAGTQKLSVIVTYSSTYGDKIGWMAEDAEEFHSHIVADTLYSLWSVLGNHYETEVERLSLEPVNE